MASFRSLTADRRPLEEFRARTRKVTIAKGSTPSHEIPLHVLEWSENTPEGVEICDLRSVEELTSRCQGTVRVIFAPRDRTEPGTVPEGLVDLFEKHSIPSAFLDESLQGVSQSFGAQKDVDGTSLVWFHFLCKEVRLENNKVVHRRDPEDGMLNEDKARLAAQAQSQANFEWSKPGFVLRVRDLETPKPIRTSSSTSDVTLAAPSVQAKAELICFGAPENLRYRLQKLTSVASCEDLLQDPYLLLEIVLDEMYRMLDLTGWNIGRSFGTIETDTLEMASQPGKATKLLARDHFTGLHNLAKHVIFLRENCDSALATLENLQDSHNAVIGDHPNAAQGLTRQALRYRKTLFQSTQRRLASLDARMANIIQLSFHIVTQGDSRLMQSENQSMKTIAVMTLIFMPLGTVASIFGTQFMKLQDEWPYHVNVSRDFWLLWVIAVPLTIIVMIVWRVWYLDARDRLIGELPRRSDNEHSYMGWKTIRSRNGCLEKA